MTKIICMCGRVIHGKEIVICKECNRVYFRTYISKIKKYKFILNEKI